MLNLRSNVSMILVPQQHSSYCFEEWEEEVNNVSLVEKEIVTADSDGNDSNDSKTSIGFGSAILENNEYLRQMQTIRFSLSPQNRSERNLGLQWMNLDKETLLSLAKDPKGNGQLKERMKQDSEFRQLVLQLITQAHQGGDEFLFQLSIDSNGNAIIQELIGNGRIDEKTTTMTLFIDMFLRLAYKMAFNRFACRILQKFITHLPDHQVRQLLCNKDFNQNETVLTTDQNGNHFVQHIVEIFPPDVYVQFIRGLNNSPKGLKPVMEHKYGCRVIQHIFEKIVGSLDSSACTEARRFEPENKRHNNDAAFEILNILLEPILKEANSLSENEHANYLVQFVIKTKYLHRQQRYIIGKHLIGNVLYLSQGKYSSHVLEQAFFHADQNCLDALFTEVLNGYKTKGTDQGGRTALHYMLFNQYGNYVVQRMIDIAIEVCNGKRAGKLGWLGHISGCVYQNHQQLCRYSSGQKILGTLQKEAALVCASMNSVNFCSPFATPLPCHPASRPRPLRDAVKYWHC